MSRIVERARGLLARGGWLDAAGAAYALRLGADRRARVVLTLDEAAFRALIATPGLRPRPGGGWVAPAPEPASPPSGRPGVIEGERTIMLADGTAVSLRANLGESPLAWLARRKDAQGRPFLSPRAVAAGERLSREAEIALAGPAVTLRWDGLPTAVSGGAGRVEPGDRALSASRRVEAALKACGVWRPVIEAVCLRGSSLQLAEQQTGLRRRRGRLALAAGLSALADHYRIG